MLQVRKMEPKDFEFAVELANTMGWNMTLQDFEFSRQLAPEGCFILLDNAKPAGLITCVSYGGVGWFGNLIVKEESRKHGAGTTLVNHAVKHLRNQGVAAVGLYAYPHLEGFYGKLGFRRDTDFVALKAHAVKAPLESRGNLKMVTQKNLPFIVDCDRNCFGASRKKLFDLLFGNPSNFGWVAVEGSGAVGFAAAKVFGDAAEVGPLVCSRSRPDLAVALLEAVLSQLGGLEAYLYLPAAEAALLDAAFKAGFGKEFLLTRMFSSTVAAKNCIYSAESLERG
ncbi:MAG: GNAT family N-acetyltransferase [Candidatus Bathyarchaeota archaeon]|nr:GNAT family N-acetyltransferase [Candidatus Bathyarchaeota archaeon]